MKWFLKLIVLLIRCSRPSREIGVGDRMPKGVSFTELRSPSHQEAFKFQELMEHIKDEHNS